MIWWFLGFALFQLLIMLPVYAKLWAHEKAEKPPEKPAPSPRRPLTMWDD